MLIDVEELKLHKNICLASCSKQSESNNSEWTITCQRSNNLEDALHLIKLISLSPKGCIMTIWGHLTVEDLPEFPGPSSHVWSCLMFSCSAACFSWPLRSTTICQQEKGKYIQTLFGNFAVFFALLITLSTAAINIQTPSHRYDYCIAVTVCLVCPGQNHKTKLEHALQIITEK